MKPSAKRLFAQSRAHLEKGEVGKAVHVLKQAIAEEPDDVSLWAEMYRQCMLAKSPQSALSAARELRRIAPTEPNYIYMHGIAALTSGQAQEAATLLEEALQRLPQATHVRRTLVQVLEALKKPERAREILQEAVDRAPTDPVAVNDLAVLLLKQGEQGKRDAEPLLRRVLSAHPDDLATHLNLALSLADRDAEAALEHADRAKESPELAIREQAQRLYQLLVRH
ncbi:MULTISPECIES: tetratricopeptide repeat protein [Stigmatella]|jgi:Flp pilus assembly protein TadD|uniref:Tetratricopeptide repeat-containing protein n=1 Tax=Stigmatella erecta TaxID=83460 RepID=A0A1I0KEA0_9BACT|nr:MULTISPECIES: tetratricopeptide repeat protein [Stigmatella]SEU22030.1 Tetratricopeptide repeat-containing protein [Stigmatella erecta]